MQEIDVQKTWFQHNPLVIMSYLSLHRKQEPLYGAKIAEVLGLSTGSVSMILRQLVSIGVVQPNPVGRTVSYSVVAGHPALAALRVFENQLILEPLVSELKEVARQIILFGSCATGEDLIDSDIDLFVLTDEPDTIREKMKRYKCERVLNPVIVDPMELAIMETNDKVFLNEIRKGTVLWERRTER